MLSEGLLLRKKGELKKISTDAKRVVFIWIFKRKSVCLYKMCVGSGYIYRCGEQVKSTRRRRAKELGVRTCSRNYGRNCGNHRDREKEKREFKWRFWVPTIFQWKEDFFPVENWSEWVLTRTRFSFETSLESELRIRQVESFPRIAVHRHIPRAFFI